MEIVESDLKNLEIQAVVFASMTALAGVYFTLVLLALACTYRKSAHSQKNLRIITLSLFAAILTHFIARSLDFARARRIPQPSNEWYKWTIPLRIVESFSTTTAGLLSDGLLAYRFWIIYGKKQWGLYIPVSAILISALLGYAASLANLAIYRYPGSLDYLDSISVKILAMSAAWAWSLFAINTTLTLSILIKLIRRAQIIRIVSFVDGKIPYALIIEAFTESAMVTWIGLLFYEVASLAPSAGHYTTSLNVGYVAICILPFFFGISQCLITVRLLLPRSHEQTHGSNFTDVEFARRVNRSLSRQDSSTEVGTPISPIKTNSLIAA